MTSETSVAAPRFKASRMIRAFDSASAFCARAEATCALTSPSCWLDNVVLLVPIIRLVVARYCSTLASASATLWRSFSISPSRHCAGIAALLLPRRLLQHQEAVGDGIDDLRGELRILRLELDRDDARLVDLERHQPVHVALEHPLLGRLAHRIPDQPGERRARCGSPTRPRSTGSNSGFSPSFSLRMTSSARPRDRMSCTWLVTASWSTVAERSVRAVRLRPQEDVFAGLDQHPRFRLVARRNIVDRGEGNRGRQQREPDDQALAAPDRAPERAQIELVDRLRYAAASGRHRTRLHVLTSTRAQLRATLSRAITDH